jgi:hypothetical protein
LNWVLWSTKRELRGHCVYLQCEEHIPLLLVQILL